MSELKHKPCPFCKSLKENFYYSNGHLRRKVSSTNSVKVGYRFGGKNKQGYISGYFTDELEAAKAYDTKAKDLHKEYGRFNFG